MRSQREHPCDRIKRWVEKTDGVVMGESGPELQRRLVSEFFPKLGKHKPTL